MEKSLIFTSSEVCTPDAEERKKELMAQNDLDTNLMFKMVPIHVSSEFGQKIGIGLRRTATVY